jgi:hypothetical protein
MKQGALSRARRAYNCHHLSSRNIKSVDPDGFFSELAANISDSKDLGGEVAPCLNISPHVCKLYLQ